jgi:hypothetical protein
MIRTIITAIAALGLAVGLSPPANAARSAVAPINLPDGATPLSGGTWPTDSVQAESWHYTGTYDDTVSFIRSQLSGLDLVDGAGKKMSLCPGAFGDSGPIVINNNGWKVTSWRYASAYAVVTIDVNSLTVAPTTLPPDGKRIDIDHEIQSGC